MSTCYIFNENGIKMSQKQLFNEIKNKVTKDTDTSYCPYENDKYITFKLSIKYDFITPGLSLVTKGDYNIKSERTVLK